MKEWLLWVDIETDGLDPNTNKILQIACILTDFRLETKHYLQEYTINYDEHELNLDDWCKQQHSDSGLLQKVYSNSSKILLKDVEKSIINFLNMHMSLKDIVYLAGNSVYFDKSFINKYMLELSKRINRRIVDVSTISILCKNMYNIIYKNKPIKTNKHTALSDIEESIDEMKHYINSGFICYNFN